MSKEKSVKELYEDFARSEGPEAKKFMDSIIKNDPLNKDIDFVMDSESRRRENNYYVKGSTVKNGKTTDTPLDKVKCNSPYKMKHQTPLEKGRCWDGYKPNPDGRPASEQGSCVKI